MCPDRLATLSRLLAGVLVLFSGTALPALAQMPFSINVPSPTRTVDLGGFTTFEIHVMNRTPDSLTIRATRTVNDLPDAAWHSSVCSINTCYEEYVSVLPGEGLSPNGMTGYTVHVTAGTRYGDSARIVLRFDSGPGSESIEQVFVVVTAPRPQPLVSIGADEVVKTAEIGDTVEFEIYAYNETSDTIGLYAERIENYFPGSGWVSVVCLEQECLPASASVLPLATIDRGKAALYRLRMVGGSVGRGRVVLRFSTTRGTDLTEYRFTLDVAGPTGVFDRSAPAASPLTLFPNPAIERVCFRLPAILPADAELTLELLAPTGERLRDLTSEARDAVARSEGSIETTVAGYPSGVLLLVLTIDGRRSVAPLVVVR